MTDFDSALDENAWRRVRDIGTADLLVGIPSFNNRTTILQVVRAAAEGMALHFPGLKGVVVDSDGGSSDGTPEAVDAAVVPEGIEKLALAYRGLPGKGSAFRAIFEAARALDVKACVVVDADLRSITPDWIRWLAGPILDGGFGYVAPYYTRHKYDGTITNSIAYPMTRALYGVSVRQPIGGDFGFSARLLEHYLAREVWQSDVARFGIDIWMTTTAINQGFQVCQARLGAKIHDAKDPAASLGPMFRQVVGTLFGLMKEYRPNWAQLSETREAPLLGDAAWVEPEAIGVTVPAMVERYHAAFQEEASFWVAFLAPDNMRQLEAIAQLGHTQFHFPIDLWVKVVYDFAVAHSRGQVEPGRLVDALTGLYYGRTASFCLETAEMSTAEVEAGPIEVVAKQFEALKPYLLQRWADS